MTEHVQYPGRGIIHRDALFVLVFKTIFSIMDANIKKRYLRCETVDNFVVENHIHKLQSSAFSGEV